MSPEQTNTTDTQQRMTMDADTAVDAEDDVGSSARCPVCLELFTDRTVLNVCFRKAGEGEDRGGDGTEAMKGPREATTRRRR